MKKRQVKKSNKSVGTIGMQIGGSTTKQTFEAAQAAILAILQNRVEAAVLIEAIRALTALCEAHPVTGTTVSSCNFAMRA